MNIILLYLMSKKQKSISMNFLLINFIVNLKTKLLLDMEKIKFKEISKEHTTNLFKWINLIIQSTS